MKPVYTALAVVGFVWSTPSVRADEYDDLNESAKKAILDGDYELAIARCDRAIRLDPNYPVAYITRSWAFLNQMKFDKAIEDCNTALTLKPTAADEAVAYNNRGNAYASKKEFEKAIKDYNRAIRADSKYPNAYAGLAWLFATCPEDSYRDGQKAFENIKKARDLDPEDANYLDIAAAVYAECSDFDQAVRFEELALKGKGKFRSGSADDTAIKEMKERLELYKKQMPYREK